MEKNHDQIHSSFNTLLRAREVQPSASTKTTRNNCPHQWYALELVSLCKKSDYPVLVYPTIGQGFRAIPDCDQRISSLGYQQLETGYIIYTYTYGLYTVYKYTNKFHISSYHSYLYMYVYILSIPALNNSRPSTPTNNPTTT